jgi:hypothetical protein
MDLLCALIGLGLWALCPRGTLISVFLIGWTGMHFTSALQNGIPLDNGLVVNDAGNIRVLRQSPEARRAFWCALNVSDALRTTRLRDMPEEWFPLPGDGEPLNVLSVQLFCNRLALAMDRQDFPAARALLERMEDPELPLPGVHRASAALERMYLDLLEQGPAADISLLREAAASRRPVKAASHDPEDLRQRKIVLNCLRALERTSLTLQRVRYAAALLKDRDPDWQDASLRAFEAIAADSPYAGDTAMERELLETARLRAEASAEAPDKAE